jgi:hypothetical protein
MVRGLDKFLAENFLGVLISLNDGKLLAVPEMQAQPPVCYRDGNLHGFFSLSMQ